MAVDRSREDAWCRRNPHVLRALAGKWLVVEGDRLIAHDEDPGRAMDVARARGVRVPYLVFAGGTSRSR